MNPAKFAKVMVSIDRKYGLKLDARSVWVRVDAFKRVPELKGGKCDESKGWYGLRGRCKRGKRGEGLSKVRQSKMEIASAIRDRKYAQLTGRNAPPVRPYNVVDTLGSGVFGQAFLTDRGTVVKSIEEGYGISRDDLESEFNGLKQFNSLGIGPKPIGLSENEIEMQLVKGQTLDDLQKELTPTQFDELRLKSGRTLLKLHESGWSHNDAHGGNIVLGDDGRIQLIDAGLSKKIGDNGSIKTGLNDLNSALLGHPVHKKIAEALRGDLEEFQREFGRSIFSAPRAGARIKKKAVLKLHSRYLKVAREIMD